MTEPCNCPACVRGLFCADGSRGQFVRGVDTCAACGELAWKHNTRMPKFKVGTQ